MSLTVVIVAWNEQENLPTAVASARRLTDDILVVDTESTDRTVEVAAGLGCRVLHHKNTGIVEPVRNFSISQATGDWVFLLDADEEIPPRLAGEIKRIMSSGKADYCRIPRKNIIFSRWIKSDHWWPDYVYRLFKKGAVTWDNAIHSLPITHGTGMDLPAREELAIVHHNYSSVSQYLERSDRYTDHQQQLLLSRGRKFVWTDLVTRPGEEFLSQYFARRGYKDGLHGLALAGLQAVSEFVLYLKLWQSAKFPPAGVAPEEVQAALSAQARDFRWWFYQSKISETEGFRRYLLKLARKLSL